jgi:threonine dehydrogenase-like Zn-dependent dehydrogenase
VGERLADQYKVGDRFIVQADIYKDGVNYAYGYMIQGGLSKYGVADQRVLNGDHGNYLIPVQPGTGYAESALTEPWACVTAAYELTYRTEPKPGGTMWVIGPTPPALLRQAQDRLLPAREGGADAPPLAGEGVGERSAGEEYFISIGFDEHSHPARLLLTNVPPAFAGWLRERATALGIQTSDVSQASEVTAPVDDIILLAADPDLIEAASPHLADFGVFAIIADRPLPRRVNVDVGRVHYNRWVYVGGTGPDIAAAYRATPVRSALKPGGRAWFIGAAGPMGRMHVQRAIQVADGPATIVCTDVSDLRLNDLAESYAAEAAARGIEFICLNPMNRAAYEVGMARFGPPPGLPPLRQGEGGGGFDDVVVLAPVPALIADGATWLAERGVMNIFAGVARGTIASLDLSDAYLRQTRVIGHSASSIDDLRFMLFQAETGTLSPNRSVAAIGSLNAAADGLKAVKDQVYPGKIVIYPHIKPLPLTALPDLKDVLPTVYAKLKDGREWTNEAEAELLRVMLEYNA